MDVDENFEWLTSIRKPEGDEVFRGTLSMNLKLASARAIDDGATVVSRLNELRRLHQAASEHAEMVQELEAKEAVLQAQQKTLAEKDQIIQELQAQLAQQHLASTGVAESKTSKEDSDMQQDDGDEDEEEEEDGKIAGEVEAADMEDESDDDDDEDEQHQAEDDESFSTVQASLGGEGMMVTHEQHNDETAQADAGGGSSGSGS